MSTLYPNAPAMIRDRARLLYGSIAHLSREVGLTRQAFHARIGLATRNTHTHSWFEFLLMLPEGTIERGASPEVLAHRPSAAELAYVVGASDSAWKNRRRTRTRRRAS